MPRLKQLEQDGAATGNLLAWDGSTWAPAAQNQEEVTTQTITNSDTAMTDTLDNAPLDVNAVMLFLNGVIMRPGAGNDYTISGSTITWLASSGTAPNMRTSDIMDVWYLS